MNELKEIIYNGSKVRYLQGRERNYYSCADIKLATGISYYLSTAVSNNNLRDKVEYCIKVPSSQVGKSSLYISVKCLEKLATIFTKEDDVALLRAFIENVRQIEGVEEEHSRNIQLKDYVTCKFFLCLDDRNVDIVTVYPMVEDVINKLVNVYNTLSDRELRAVDDLSEFDMPTLNKLIELIF